MKIVFQKNFLYFLSVAAIFITATKSFAQEAGGGARAGLIYGFIVPDADNTNPRQLWGVMGSANMNPTFSFGGYYLLAPKDEGTGAREFAISIHGLSASYHISSNRGDTFFGVRAGLSKVKSSENGVDLIYSPYHYGIAAGYDYSVFSRMSMGFEGCYLRFKESDTTQAGTTYIEPQFNTISFAISIKIVL